MRVIRSRYGKIAIAIAVLVLVAVALLGNLPGDGQWHPVMTWQEGKSAYLSDFWDSASPAFTLHGHAPARLS